MYRLTLIVSFISFTVLFNACSNSSSDAQEYSYISVCSDEDSFTKLELGDILKNEDNNTRVKIVHREDGSRYACTVNGKAYIK